MGGEKYRILVLRKSDFTQSEKCAYASLLPRFRRLFKEHLIDDQHVSFRRAIKETGDPMPVKLLMSAEGAVPVLLESRRAGFDEGFAKLPQTLVELVLGHAYTQPGTVETGRRNQLIPLDASRLYLLAACPRPYDGGPLVLLKELTPDFEFGWQDRSYSRGLDPLGPFADKVMDELLRALPRIFEENEEDDWADQMRAELEERDSHDSYDIDNDSDYWRRQDSD